MTRNKRLPFLLALGTLVGCGYDFDTFMDEFTGDGDDPEPGPKPYPGPGDLRRAMEGCDFFQDYFTYDDCVALGDVEDSVYECDDYDSSAAKDCVDAWASVSCDDFLRSEGLVKKVLE